MIKKIGTAIVALTLFISAAQAQDNNRHHNKGHKGNHERMAKDLDLTEAQKTQLKQQRESMMAEMKAVKENGSLTQAQAKEQRKAIHEKYKAQREQVLTPEQRAKVKSGKKEYRNKSVGFNNERIRKIEQELNLTPDQKSKLTGIYSSFQSRRESVATNSTLNREQKKEQMNALTQEHIAQARAILNDEQEKKAEAMLKDRKFKGRK
jgi:protein CpxP